MIGTRAGARAAVLLLSAALVVGWSASARALCGDASGDGYVSASDALAALKAAVGGLYDPRLDVAVTDTGDPDGQVTASDALAVLRDAVAATIPRCAAAQASRAFLTTAACDHSSGGLAEMDVRDLSILERRPGAASGDAVIRVQDGRVFVLNRYGADNVQEVDPDTGLTTSWQCSVGPGANPHDIVVVSDTKAYVTRYDMASLAIVDPSAGDDCAHFVTGEIDLSAYADADGIPEMDQMVLVDGHLFVAIQRLDRHRFFIPTTTSALVVIDTATNLVTGSVEMAFTNPFVESKGLFYDPRSDRIWVGGPGTLFLNQTDGGIERIDPHTLASDGLIVTGSDLGGDLTDFVVAGNARAFAIVADKNFVASLVDVDLTSGNVRHVLTTSEFDLADVEMTEDGRLWLADRNCFDPGIRVFEIGGDTEITDSPIYPGLSPFNVVFGR
jgi:hypothetical protein